MEPTASLDRRLARAWDSHYHAEIVERGAVALGVFFICPKPLPHYFVYKGTSTAMSGSNASDKAATDNDESRASDAEGDGSASDERGHPTMCLTSDEVNYLIFRYVQNRR